MTHGVPEPVPLPPIEVELRPLFEAMAANAATTPVPTDLDERRQAADRTMLLIHPGPEPGVTVRDHEVPVEGGSITVRVARPGSEAGAGPAYFFVHGGGWFQGNLDTAEVECGPMASRVPCTVVSVDYRLAPEHPFPVPLDDCVAAYEWMHAHAGELGVDPARVVVGGTSAGANLSAALCLVARDRGLPMPLAQLLDVPALDLAMASPSIEEKGEGGGLTKDGVDEFVRFYTAGGTPRDHPLVSPLHADLAGLPPAVVAVAEHDPVRDDGERYVHALHAAGVPATGLRVLANLHGSWIVPITATHRLLQDLRTTTLRRAFEGTLVP